jgi:hypothetical protein
MMSMMTGDVPLDPRAAQSLPQGPVEFTSEGNTFRIVLKDAEISINGLPLIPFGILTALHGMWITFNVRQKLTNHCQSCSSC